MIDVHSAVDSAGKIIYAHGKVLQLTTVQHTDEASVDVQVEQDKILMTSSPWFLRNDTLNVELWCEVAVKFGARLVGPQ